MKKSQSTRSTASPFLASSSSHTTFHSIKPTPQDHGGLWPNVHVGSHGGLLSNTPSTTMVMVQEDGQCDLSIDGSFVGTPVMGGGDPGDGLVPRYVAGNNFFNYQLYGGLRKGGSVSFLSPAYRGYALAAFLSGYVYVVVMYLLLRIPEQALRLDQSTRLKNVLSLQWTVVLLVGILSDAYAPLRLRRKSYMVAGWIASGVGWLVLFLLFQFSSAPPHNAILTLIVVAFLSLIVATNAMDIRIIELSQQEELQYRGRLLGTYEVVRISAQVITHSLIAIVTQPDPKNLDVHLPFGVEFVFLHLALLCWIPIYWLIHNAHEDQVSQHAAPTVAHAGLSLGPVDPVSPPAPSTWTHFKAMLKRFWQSAQQRVVWQLMLFNCVLFFFGFFELSDVKRAQQYWAYDSSIVRLVRNCLGDVSFVAVLLVWRAYGLNANWRFLTAGAIIFVVVVSFMISSLVIYDVVRSPWIFTLSWVLRAPFRVLMLLAAFVPTIEIAPHGTEGTTYALLAAFQTVVKFLAVEIATVVMKDWPAIQFSYKKMKETSSHTENAQFYGLIVMTLWMLCALGGIFCLPQQKLDAQQLRAYGGYSRWPLMVLIVGFLAATPYVFYVQIARLQT